VISVLLDNSIFDGKKIRKIQLEVHSSFNLRIHDKFKHIAVKTKRNVMPVTVPITMIAIS
jgi:hypothetical protein